jgi:hypothetical protein
VGELDSRRYEPLERLIAQFKTQRVSFDTYFPPKKKNRFESRRLELAVAVAISIMMWLGIDRLGRHN